MATSGTSGTPHPPPFVTSARRSNFKMIAETLLPHVPLPFLNVHPMPAPRCDAAAAGARRPCAARCVRAVAIGLWSDRWQKENENEIK